MPKVLKLSVGDRVRLKKPHPCGSHEWEILRAGADVKAKCVGCGRIVAHERVRFERRVRAFTHRAEGMDATVTETPGQVPGEP